MCRAGDRKFVVFIVCTVVAHIILEGGAEGGVVLMDVWMDHNVSVVW